MKKKVNFQDEDLIKSLKSYWFTSNLNHSPIFDSNSLKWFEIFLCLKIIIMIYIMILEILIYLIIILSMTQDHKDEELWKIAKKRVEFKESLIRYVAVNGFLWVIWYFTMPYKDNFWTRRPIWPTFWWGIALVVEYYKLYSNPYESAVDKEYKRLKNK